jgi:amino acid transporter
LDPGRDLRRGGFLELSLIAGQRLEDPMVAAVDVTSPQHQVPELPDGFWHAAKRRLLGPPLVTEQLTASAYPSRSLSACCPATGSHRPRTAPRGSSTHCGALYIMAKAFANGGSSLTGIEAVSNAVSALRPPESRNARQILTMQGSIVAFLIAGISWLAHITHATPYTAGFPTVLAQEAGQVFGHTPAGQVMFYVLQAATAAILFTGGNTSFTGFPFLASFVAEDSFLPRWLTRRGHRLVFSNGIVLLGALSLTLMLVAAPPSTRSSRFTPSACSPGSP